VDQVVAAELDQCQTGADITGNNRVHAGAPRLPRAPTPSSPRLREHGFLFREHGFLLGRPSRGRECLLE
jgi:hypothetical protein